MNLYYLPVVILCIMAPLLSSAEEEPIITYGKPEISKRTKRLSNEYKVEIKSGRFRERVHKATDAIIRLAAYKLKRDGFKKESQTLLKEWKEHEVFFTSRVGIGAHAPLSQWLSDQYKKWEFLLSKDVVHTLRLDDIHTINHAIPVVFSCIDSVDRIEYFMHLCHDDINIYRGLLPVTAFWTSFFSCIGFSWVAPGVNYAWCSPIAMGVEVLSDQVICPQVDGFLYGVACNK